MMSLKLNRKLLVMLLLWGIVVLSACAIDQNRPTPFPTTPPLVGSITIQQPQSGTIVYAETLTIAGTALGLPTTGEFRLRVVTATDAMIADSIIKPQADGTWSLELVHNYIGDPTEVTVMALPTDPTIIGDYDIVSVMFGKLEERPTGTFGVIQSPTPDSVIGGDIIPIYGTLAGIGAVPVTIALENADGIISQQRLDVSVANALDEIPWRADLLTNGYTGPAFVHLYTSAADGNKTSLDKFAVMIGISAG